MNCIDIMPVAPSSVWDLKSLGMISPTSVTYNDGLFVIVDQITHALYWLDNKGKAVLRIGSKGKNDDQFHYPTGIFSDDEHTLWVTDRWNHRVKRLSADGKTLLVFGKYGSKPGEFSEPWGISVWHNTVIVADRNNHRIQCFDKQGNFIRCFGISGPDKTYYEGNEFKKGFVFETWCKTTHRFAGPATYFHKEDYKIGTLEYPCSVAVSQSGTIFVVDSGNDRIQEFSHDGELKQSFTKNDGTFGMEFIAYIACFGDDSLAISSELGDTVYILDKNRRLTAHLSVPGSKLNYVFPADDTLWVADSWNSKLYKFMWK